MPWQAPLDPKYRAMDEAALDRAIIARKAELGDRLVILGHHYQQDDVIRHADFIGDSFKLSGLAAQKVREAGARHVIFCGVHFMAESADILTPEDVTVTLPDLSAGCSMADMANLDEVVEAWRQLHEVLDASDRVVPITYMNSTAAIKAFVGEHGGAVCTSSNAAQIMRWAFEGGTEPKRSGERVRVLFLPDQHLGRNTAADLGVDVGSETCVWDPRTAEPLGGNGADDLRRAAVILWKGHCSVHKLFRPEHVDQVRAQDPDVRVIVHPECDRSVVLRADLNGSTEKILRVIGEAEAGTSWAVGTEVHMVQRLAREAAPRGVKVRMLSDCQCLCTTMYRIDPQHVLWSLDELIAGRVPNPVRVDAQTRRWSLVALQRMLEITEAAPAPTP